MTRTHHLTLLLALPCALAATGPPAAAQAGEPPLRVGLTGKYPPFNFFGPDGELIGFDVDYSREICALVGRECEFVILQWDGIINALLADKIDTVIGSMGITEERAQQVDFSVPYYESGAQLFLVDPDAAPEDLDGVRIGLTLGTTYGPYARREFPKADLRYYKGDVEVLQDLKAGRVDGILTDRLVGFFMRREFGVEMHPAGELLFIEQMAIPVKPGNDALLAEINRAITTIRSGEIQGQLFEKYFGRDAVSRSAKESYTWDRMLTLMASALLDTLELALLGLLLGMLLAALLAAGILALPRPLSLLISAWVDFIRATPFLVQLFMIYFGLPTIGIEMSAWMAAMIGIALHSSAYVSEILKVAFKGIPIGQRHAAQTLGLTRFETLRHVIIPQMLPLISVPVLNTVVAMIKDSAIVSVISVHELTMQTQQLISATFKPMELYLVAAAMYFAITYPLLIAGRALEKRYQRKGLLHA